MLRAATAPRSGTGHTRSDACGVQAIPAEHTALPQLKNNSFLLHPAAALRATPHVPTAHGRTRTPYITGLGLAKTTTHTRSPRDDAATAPHVCRARGTGSAGSQWPMWASRPRWRGPVHPAVDIPKDFRLSTVAMADVGKLAAPAGPRCILPLVYPRITGSAASPWPTWATRPRRRAPGASCRSRGRAR